MPEDWVEKERIKKGRLEGKEEKGAGRLHYFKGFLLQKGLN